MCFFKKKTLNEQLLQNFTLDMTIRLFLFFKGITFNILKLNGQQVLEDPSSLVF